jgi:hypothetical protein
MEDFATVAPKSQMTTHVKGPQQNVEKTEIDISHSAGNRIIEESVAACAQKQRRQKTNEDNRKKTKTTKYETNLQ